VTQIIGIVNEK